MVITHAKESLKPFLETTRKLDHLNCFRPQSAVTLGKPLGDVIDLTLDSDNEDETYASRQDNTTNVTTSNDVCEPSDANKQASLQQMIENLRTRLASDKVSSSKSSDATPRSRREESKVLHQTGEIFKDLRMFGTLQFIHSF